MPRVVCTLQIDKSRVYFAIRSNVKRSFRENRDVFLLSTAEDRSVSGSERKQCFGKQNQMPSSNMFKNKT